MTFTGRARSLLLLGATGALLSFSGLTHAGEPGEFLAPQVGFVVTTADGFAVAGLRLDVSYYVDSYDTRRAPIRDSWFKCVIGYERPRMTKRKLRTDVFHTGPDGSAVIPERREVLPREMKARPSDNIEISADTMNLGLQLSFTASNGQSVLCGMPVPPLGTGGRPLRELLGTLHTASLLQPEYRLALAVSRAELESFEERRMGVCRDNAEILLRSHPAKTLPEVVDSRYPLSQSY